MPDDYTYTPLQNYMLGVTADNSLTLFEKCVRIYDAMPVTEDGWEDFPPADKNAPNAEIIKLYAQILDKVQYYVPTHMIIEKCRKVIEAHPIDISEIADLRRIGPHGTEDDGQYIFIKKEWAQLGYIDPGIALPNLPNMQYSGYINGRASPERQREFIDELRVQDDDYILNFMLTAILPYYGPAWGGLFSYKLKPGTDCHDAVAYASFEELHSFPQWYRAWNLLVPTMCQRYEGGNLLPWGDIPQRACGNMIEGEEYRMPLSRYRELKAKNLIERNEGVE